MTVNIMSNNLKIGIIGLGLIGASILEGLKDKYELFCYSKSSASKVSGAIASSDIKIVQNCDIIFVCTELSKTLQALQNLNSFLDKKTLVVDVASSKKELLNKEFNFNFILSHPMAGSEKAGFEAKDKDLFKGAKWLIEKNNSILEELIVSLGAIPLKIDMNEHDKLCAQISHLPTILSFLLFDIADDKAKQIASSGFRDTTRLAMTNSDLAFNMLKNNEENILNAFKHLEEKLNHLKKLSNDEKIKLFNEIAAKRKKMYDNNGKNIFKI